MLNRRQRKIPRENLWNFIEATDFTFNILTGQGTGRYSFLSEMHVPIFDDTDSMYSLYFAVLPIS